MSYRRKECPHGWTAIVEDLGEGWKREIATGCPLCVGKCLTTYKGAEPMLKPIEYRIVRPRDIACPWCKAAGGKACSDGKWQELAKGRHHNKRRQAADRMNRIARAEAERRAEEEIEDA